MQILYKSIKRRCAVELDERNLRDLLCIIQRFYPNNTPRIIAALKDNREVEFFNADDLFKHDNHGNSRIVGLCIVCDKNYKIAFVGKFPPKNFIYTSTIEIEFSIGEQERYTLLLTDIENFLSKVKLSMLYSVIINAVAPVLLIFYSVLFFIFFNNILKIPFNITDIFVITLLIVAATFATSMYIKPIWQKIFCPIYFFWGEEVKRLKKIDAIIIYLVGFATGLFVNYLSGLMF